MILPDHIERELLKSITTPSDVVTELRDDSDRAPQPMPQHIFEDLVRMIRNCINVYEEAETEAQNEATRLYPSYDDHEQPHEETKSNSEAMIPGRSSVPWKSADHSAQQIHFQLMHDDTISKYASNRTRYGAGHDDDAPALLESNERDATPLGSSGARSDATPVDDAADDHSDSEESDSHVDPALRRRIHKLRTALQEYKDELRRRDPDVTRGSSAAKLFQ